MNILFVSSVDVSGGATTALINLAVGLRSRGHNVYVVLKKSYGGLSRLLDNNSIPYYDIPVGMTVYPTKRQPLRWLLRLLVNVRHWYTAQHKIECLIHDLSIDIVHSNVGPVDIGFRAAKKTRTIHVWHQREELDVIGIKFFPSFSHFYKECHSNFNYNIAITESVFEHYNLRREHDIVIYDGVLSSKVLSTSINKEKEKYVLFVGRIEHNKQPSDVIKAFSQFYKKHHDYTLLLVGPYGHDKEHEEICRALIQDNELDESVHFLGARNDVLRLMSRAKMFIMSSLSEGFGFTTVEAMCMGTPVIGRNTSGTKEQFDRGLKDTGEEIGLRFNDVEELVSCMERCLSDDLNKMIQNARDYVVSQYTIEHHVDLVEKYYKKISQ